MVSTRSGSSVGPESTPATPTTTTRSKRKSVAPSATSTAASTSPTRSASSSTAVASTRPRRTRRTARSSGWEHAPTPATLLWMGLSLPLVVWDTGYVLGRPHTMEGGWLHRPFYSPYKLYGEVDHIYGWKAFNAGNGFTSAQGFLNVIETLMYFLYLWLWYSRGTANAEGSKTISGRLGALTVLIGFSSAVMTLSKTVLYWANEYYSGFDGIGHNDAVSLLFLWIIPNGAWLVGSTYMIYTMGGEIVEGLDSASSHSKSD